nr:TonB-dependent receptor [uncultured Neokomagataea sp.]
MLYAATTLATFHHAFAAPSKSVDAAQHAENISVTASSSQRAAHTIDHKTRELQHVSQAATRVDARQLKAEHITNLTQATRLLPTVQFNIANPRVSAINIRGLGAAGTGATDGIEGGVAVYVDGVYRPRPATAMSDLPGLNGITVLRGPSGTAGGMVTTAGAIELTTTAPDLYTRHITAEAGAGNYNYNRWSVGISTPLIKNTLAVRIDTLGYAYSGWVHNLSGGGDINGVTNRSVRTQILYHPTDELDVRLIGDYSHLRENCCSGSLYKIVTQRTNGTIIGGNLLQRAAWSHYTPVPPSDTPYTIDRDSLSQANQEDMGLSAQANWHHAGFTLSSITAYRAWNWWPLNDGDLNGINAQTNTNLKVNQRQFSQEFRFTNQWGQLLDYRLGAFYLWQENDVAGDQAYGSDAGTWFGYGTSSAPVAGVTAAQAGNALNGYNVRNYAQPTTNYYALYSDGTWHLSKTFDLVTGARYNYGVKTGSFAQWQDAPSSYSPALTPLGSAQKIWNTYGANNRFSGHLDNGFVTGQVALQYHPTQNLMLYGRYAHGGKSGGLNLTPLSAQQIASGAVSPNVGKETDDAFEVGVKLTTLQGRLLFAGALYQTNDHNYQVTAVREFQGSLLSYLSSAPKVRVRGAEADIHYSPLPNLTTSLSASYNDAQFLEYTTSAPSEIASTGPYSLAHTQIPFVPRWALSASAQYYHTLGKIGRSLTDAYAGGSYNYNTRENTSANNSMYGWVPGYGTLNVNFGLRDHQGRWDISGFINNATDERRISQVVQGSGVSGNGAWYAYVTQPRNFGFIARVNY